MCARERLILSRPGEANATTMSRTLATGDPETAFKLRMLDASLSGKQKKSISARGELAYILQFMVSHEFRDYLVSHVPGFVSVRGS